MPDTTRQKVYDAAVYALGSSTGIAYTTKRLDAWWDWPPSRYPGVCVIDGAEDKSRFSFMGAASTDVGDMTGRMELVVHGYCFDPQNDLDGKRSALIRDIEVALTSSTALDDLTLDVTPVAVETDEGVIDNYSLVKCRYLVRYLYNHAYP
jgi:hypothetical protein